MPLWEEQWTGSNGVQVSDGLFNVMLGSLTPIPQSVITGHDSLFLGITVGTDDEMTPRVQLGTVPFAVQALTVPDGSITQAKAPFAAEAYLGLSQHGDIKTLAATYVVLLTGGQAGEEFSYDISSLGFSEQPYAICQLTNVHVETEFCHYDFDASTNSTLKFLIRRYDGGNVGGGLRRMSIILFGR